ncbi:MAG: cob(I)yrinic acid a,c-diamide adenosyltransferase [Nitriliruptoraceae bacterium]
MPTSTSIVFLLTGTGWGKSAAAFGYVTRAWGRGWTSAVVQFVKGAEWNRAERRFATKLDIEWHTLSDGVTWGASEHGPAELGRRAWNLAADRIGDGSYDLVVLDELTVALEHDWVHLDEVIETLLARPRRTNVIVTGQTAPEELRAIADTVTDLQRTVYRGEAGILGK